jgi:Protein of unknown function (DUF3098)
MNNLPFGKKNYQRMIIGLIVVALGFTLMAVDKNQFGWLGLTVAPIVVIAGFVVEIFAILHTPEEK